MRLTTVMLAVLLVYAGPGLAAKKKKRPSTPKDTVAIVVLPFVGKGTGASDAKEAIELELELVDVAKVEASDAVESDLRGKGRHAFETATLASVLAARNIDVLIRGERGAGEKPDALLVTAYGKDGQPRFYKELALGSEPDVTASTIVTALKPDFSSWRSMKIVKIPVAGAEKDVKPEDVLADDEPPPPKKKATPVKSALDDDDPPPPPPKKRSGDDDDVKKASPLDFNDPADAAPKVKKRKRGLDDDPPLKIARTEIDENGRKRTIDDVDDTVKTPDTSSAKLGHALALSGAFDGATWYYGFDGGGVGDTSVAATFYPGGSFFADAWPLSFAGINWVGLDGEVALAAVPFRISGGDVAVTPAEFTSLQIRAAGALKLRYTLKNGIGLGARFGYRYFGASVETQTIDVGGQAQNLTVVPGYTLHAGVVGAEVFLPILIGGHRFEVEVRADGLPLTYYEEAPDNPGATTLAFGWNASLAARYDVISGFFLEARGQTTGVNVTYTQQGSRFALVGNQLQQLEGGTVLNLTAGFSVGLGYMF